MRAWTVEIERHPEQLPAAMKAMMEKFQEQWRREHAAKKRT